MVQLHIYWEEGPSYDLRINKSTEVGVKLSMFCLCLKGQNTVKTLLVLLAIIILGLVYSTYRTGRTYFILALSANLVSIG